MTLLVRKHLNIIAMPTTMTCNDQVNHPHTAQQQTARPKPEQPGVAVQLRFVAHEFAIAIDHEVDDLLITLTFIEHAKDLFSQIGGDGGIGVCDILVLTFRTTQFPGQLGVPGAFDLILERVSIDGSLGCCR